MENKNPWRTGTNMDVYDGYGRLICQCQSGIAADLIVAAVNYAHGASNLMPMSSGVEAIAVERFRQKEEGRSPEHDAQHDSGELAEAAIFYIDPYMEEKADIDKPWPMEPQKHPYVRRLTIAGALIAAEIDRLLALAEIQPETGDDSVPLDPAARGKA